MTGGGSGGFVGRKGRSLSGLDFGPCVMRPGNEKDYCCERYAGRGKGQGLHPAAVWYRSFVEARARARQKRGGDFSVRVLAETGVDGGE